MPIQIFKSNNESRPAPCDLHPFVRNRNMALYGTDNPIIEQPLSRYEALKAKGWNHLNKVEKEEYRSLMPQPVIEIKETQPSTSSPEVAVVSPDETTSNILDEPKIVVVID